MSPLWAGILCGAAGFALGAVLALWSAGRRAHSRREKLLRNLESNAAELREETARRRRVEQALEGSEAQARAILDSAVDAIVSIDERGIIRGVNPATERMFGYSREEMLGRNVSLLMPEPHAGAHDGHIRRYLETGRSSIIGVGRETLAKRKDGSTFPIELAVSEVRAGGVHTFTGVMRDVTERKRFEQEILRQTAELERSNQELEQFAYVASHDLQEPLRVVASYNQLLQRRYAGRLDAEADEFIAFSIDGVTRMRQLIQGLLDYSRVGMASEEFCDTDLESVLDETLANLQEAIDESGARILRRPLPRVRADRVQMVRMLQNLISNAIKFRGERSPEISIGAEQHEDEWVVWVADNGIGIDPRHADRVFQIFQRLHTPEEYAGTGVGLAVCKKIVERHGGRIWIDRAPGGGSVMRFSLPVAGSPERSVEAGKCPKAVG